VAAIRGGLLRCKDWAALAEELKRGPLSPEAAAKASQRRMEGLLEAFNFLVDSSMGCGDKEDRQTDKDTGLGVIKLSLYRKPPSGAMQPWSDIEFHVDRSKDPVKVSLKVCRRGSGFFVILCWPSMSMHQRPSSLNDSAWTAHYSASELVWGGKHVLGTVCPCMGDRCTFPQHPEATNVGA
jgi:hypothetical protein